MRRKKLNKMFKCLKRALYVYRAYYTAESEGRIRGVSIYRNGPRVSHLFFADNSVLFWSAKESECQVILDILATYEKGSGQKINKDKTNLFFSSNTDPGLQIRIQQILGVPSIKNYEKYLGPLALVGLAKKQSFIYIKERILKKSFKVGRKNSYHRPVEKYSTNLWSKPFSLTPWVALSYQEGWNKKLRPWFVSFGRATVGTIGKSVRLGGSVFVKPRRLDVWVLRK